MSYIYHPSFIDPPVDESELDEDGLTEQDPPRGRVTSACLTWHEATIPLAGLVHISAATQAEPAEDPTTPAAAKGRGKRPRYLPGDLRPSAVTTRSDPKYQQDLDAGLTSQDAFKRHKSRFRALLHAMKSGKDIPNTPARQGRTTGELPPLQSRGRRHKEEMLWRLEQLRRRGIVPTREKTKPSIWTACLTISRQTSPQGMSVRETDGQINGGSPRAGMTRRTTSQSSSRRLRALPPLERTALARPHRRAALALGMSTTGPQTRATRPPPAQLGHPPKRYQEPLWRWRRREPGHQRKRSASPGTTQTWPRIMMNRGSPADLRWAPVHGSPRAEDGATPIGVADVGVAGALAAAAPLLSSYRCIF